MSVKERILTIRLLEKIAKDPAYAHTIGIENAVEISEFYKQKLSPSTAEKNI